MAYQGMWPQKLNRMQRVVSIILVINMVLKGSCLCSYALILRCLWMLQVTDWVRNKPDSFSVLNKPTDFLLSLTKLMLINEKKQQNEWTEWDNFFISKKMLMWGCRICKCRSKLESCSNVGGFAISPPFPPFLCMLWRSFSSEVPCKNQLVSVFLRPKVCC